MKWWHLFIFLLVGSLAACQAETPVAETTAVPSPTPIVTRTIAATQIPTPIASPLPTPTPGHTAVFLPLPTMSPFPTITPHPDRTENKPVFLMLATTGGDGGGDHMALGSDLPAFVIFGDGHMLRRSGQRGAYRLEETYLTAAEMCDLRQRIVETGFLEPHDDYYTDHEGSDGAPYLNVQLEAHWFDFYTPDLPYLIEEMAAGLELIQSFSPESPLTIYLPGEMAVWIDPIEPEAPTTVAEWPSDLPPLADLWTNRDAGAFLVPPEHIAPLYAWFDHRLSPRVINEDDTYYRLIPVPRIPAFARRRPLEYVPVLACDDQPGFISPAIPTITPSPAPETAVLQGAGRIVLATAVYSDHRIDVLDADGTNRTRLTHQNGRAPAWSPDGQRIAFVAWADGADQIFTMNPDGTAVVQLTAEQVDTDHPTWSPDGSQILFVKDRGTWKKTGFYLMNADGSDIRLLLDNDDRNLAPDWSPDGERIVYVKEIEFNKEYALYLIDSRLAEPVEQQIPIAVEFPFSPAWASTGEQIAFTYYDNDRQGSVIAIITPDGTPVAEYPLPVKIAGPINWSHNAAYFFFSAYDQGNADIYALEIASGNLIQITHTEADEKAPSIWP